MAKRTADSSIVATRLKMLRKESKIKTQVDLAKATNIPLISIKRYESGETVPEHENLQKLSQFYRVQAEWILGFSEHRSPWEKYDNEHTKEINDVQIELKLLEYCEHIGCSLYPYINEEEIKIFLKEIDDFIISKYNQLKGENNE